jgi:pimeloyl-ACP methyl ester carboxylesterase
MHLKTNGIRLNYEKSGNGPALILLHGNSETHHIFDNAAISLAHHFTVYAIDTRGHGESSPVREFHYDDMADDIVAFITQLGLHQPALYGFSDGGIVGLLVAIRRPDLLSRLIISGANTNPAGLKPSWFVLFRLIYTFNRSPLLKLMLTEPDITADMLQSVTVPTHITAGSRDMIRNTHTQMIHRHIQGSTLKTFQGETHSSYIVNSEKIAAYLIGLLAK